MSDAGQREPAWRSRSDRLSAGLHGGAALLSAVGGAALLWSLPAESGGRTILALAAYGVALVLVFASSATYHAWPQWARRDIPATLDHCAIYILIAGTYTPFGLIALHGRGGALVVAIEWGLALLGVLARTFWIRRLHRLSVPIYIAMGWLGLPWWRPLLEAIGPVGVALTVAGGVAYSAGTLFFRWHRLPYHNALWHLFVVAGAVLHFWAIAGYVLAPAARAAGLP